MPPVEVGSEVDGVAGVVAAVAAAGEEGVADAVGCTHKTLRFLNPTSRRNNRNRTGEP